MGFRPEVAEAIGEDRAAEAWSSAEILIAMADDAPAAASNVVHRVVELEATNREDAGVELMAMIRASRDPRQPSRWWSAFPLQGRDGRFRAIASPYFQHQASDNSPDLRFAFPLSAIHLRLGAWWSNHVWRAAELARGARDGLDQWNILVAAACARSLLEGAAYIAVETPEILRLWDGLKSKGHPRSGEVTTFLSELENRTMSAHYSSKLLSKPKSKGEPNEFLEARSILSYMEKIAKCEPASDVSSIYAFLCDAIHPSFGSAMRYCVHQQSDALVFLEHYYRDPLPHTYSGGNNYPPCIAEAAAGAISLAAGWLNRDLPTVRWLMDDIYLTAELQPPSGDLLFPWSITAAQRNAACPCGSGRKSKRCVHRWGLPGTPPAD